MNTEKAVSTGVGLYTLAGWLSILQAVAVLLQAAVFLPMANFLFGRVMSLSGDEILKLRTGFDVVGSLAGIYVLYMFRRLLNERLNFHKADLPIYGLIFCYAAAAIIGVTDIVMNTPYNAIIAQWIISMLSNLIGIVYAIRLIKLDDNLNGLLKPYVYLTIAGGVCGATIVLSQIGSLIYMVSLILLGIIMIRAESAPEYL
jgi:hypothetical protein